jgi:hypothetical protein
MGIRLVGNRHTKRTDFFLKAAEQLHIPVQFVDWDEVGQADFTGDVVKLDPPSYQTSDLFKMNDQIREYREHLLALQGRDCRFLNPPEAVCQVLDKRFCKDRLAQQGIPVTEMFPERIENFKQLEEAMHRHRVYSVFIKPVFCSGAAGVSAYRRTPSGQKEAAYTSCRLQQGELINTKKMYRLEDAREIRRHLEAVLSLGAVVERWHPKSVYQGKNYDLRVVWQFGKPVFAVVRCSGGPVTNLHLNNAALEFEKLKLPEEIRKKIRCVCAEAMAVFPDLFVAGLDVLLEKDSQFPRIIEINGQGDLIYQDLYNRNQIYTEQVRRMAQIIDGNRRENVDG